MKKKVLGRKFSRGQSARVALFRSLLRALVESGSIKTTKTKAKNYQRLIDKMVNLEKRGTLSSRRILLARLGNDRETVDKLVKSVIPSLKNVKSGYTTLVSLGKRRGDNTQMVKLAWNIKEVAEVKPVKGKTKKGDKRK